MIALTINLINETYYSYWRKKYAYDTTFMIFQT